MTGRSDGRAVEMRKEEGKKGRKCKKEKGDKKAGNGKGQRNWIM